MNIDPGDLSMEPGLGPGVPLVLYRIGQTASLAPSRSCSFSNKTCQDKTLKAIVKGASKHKVKIATSVLTNVISELWLYTITLHVLYFGKNDITAGIRLFQERCFASP